MKNTEKQISLGVLARDMITGITGIVMAKADYLNGCQRVAIQPRPEKGKASAPDWLWMDIQEAEYAGIGVSDRMPSLQAAMAEQGNGSQVTVTRRGGPMPEAPKF